MPSESPAGMWPAVAARLQEELGETGQAPQLLSSPWTSRAAWGVSMPTFGETTVKIKKGGRAAEKAHWCALNLPLLAKRGSPVPSIIWHGSLDHEWHVIVQRRLPGRPLQALTRPLLAQVMELIELQANADALPTPEDRDFAGYIAHVLFDDWDDVWHDASSAGPQAEELCARLRTWLEPVWGLRLPACDFTNNDLNLSNILSEGHQITGLVDWDEFGLGSRAIDLVVLAFDCIRDKAGGMGDHLLSRATEIAGDGGLRCLITYRAIATLAEDNRERRDSRQDIATIENILDRLGAP